MTKKFRILIHQKIYLLPFLFVFTCNFLFINKIVLGQTCPTISRVTEEQIMRSCQSIETCRHFIAMIQNNNCIHNKSLVLHKTTTLLSNLQNSGGRDLREQNEQADNHEGQQTENTLSGEFNHAVTKQIRSINCQVELDPNFVGPPHPECIQQAQQEEEYLACEGKANSAWKSACKGSLFSQAAIETIRLFQSSKNTGDIKAMCESAKSLNNWAMAINAGALTVCITALSRCVSTCNAAAGESDDENKTRSRRTFLQHRAKQLADECSSDRLKYITLGGLQLARNFAAMQSAQKCEESVTDNVDGNNTPDGLDDIERTCEGLTGRALSRCRSNPPLAPRGQRVATTPLGFTNSKRKPLPKINDPEFDPDDHIKGTGPEGEDQLTKAGKYTGNGDLPASSSGLASGGSGGGGSGGGFGGGFGGGGAAPEEDGEGEEPYAEDLDPGIDTDILGDIIGGSRAGVSSLVGGGGRSGSGLGRRLADKFKGFKIPNLSKGGKGGTHRNPAGLNRINDITTANGLTNFQKVSRAMNKKRETLRQ